MRKQVIRPHNGQVLKAFSDGFKFYRFSDGSQIPLREQIAWCHSCEDFVEAEDLYSLAEIDQKLAELERRSQDPDERIAFEKFVADHEVTWLSSGLPAPRRLSAENQLVAWRSARTWRERRTMPRCLVCGCTFGVKLLRQHEGIPHPAGDGIIRIALDGVFVSGAMPSVRVYSPEATLIECERGDIPAGSEMSKHSSRFAF